MSVQTFVDNDDYVYDQLIKYSLLSYIWKYLSFANFIITITSGGTSSFTFMVAQSESPLNKLG